MTNILPRSRSLCVLCIEEDIVQRKLMEVCLDAAHIEAFAADRPQQALALFHRHVFDMIFLDFDQPREADVAAFCVMRDTSRHGRHVPILAVTNNDCRWTRAAYREMGFADLYEKPVEPMRLFRAMDDILLETGQPPLLNPLYTPQYA